MWTDVARSVGELCSLPVWLPVLSRCPRGDGHSVLVIPGLTAGDQTTFVLRRFLTRMGYDVHGWGLGVNIGPTAEVIEGLPTVLHEFAERSGGAVSLIGWSLGGIFARRLARECPDEVRQVITLGSPFRLQSHAHNNARGVYELFERKHVIDLTPPLGNCGSPLSMPSTAMYSRIDGIVSCVSCKEDPSPKAENIEICCSHFGFGHHPAALYAVADRLAQPEGAWMPFEAPGYLAWAYPDPER